MVFEPKKKKKTIQSFHTSDVANLKFVRSNYYVKKNFQILYHYKGEIIIIIIIMYI